MKKNDKKTIFLLLSLIILGGVYLVSGSLITGCNPDSGGDCTVECNWIFKSVSGDGWAFDGTDSCTENSGADNWYVANDTDSNCDTYLGAGTEQCAYVSGETWMGQIYCPSYERNGNSAVAYDDCYCLYEVYDQVCNGDNQATVEASFNFSHEFFAIATEAPDNPPVVTLSVPANATSLENPQDLTFQCNITDDNKIINVTFTLYNGSGNIINTSDNVSLTGTSITADFNQSFVHDGNFSWNCLSYDNASQSDWADANWTLEIKTTPPIIYPETRFAIRNLLNNTDMVWADDEGNLFVRGNLTMKSPNGSWYECGVDDAGTWGCS